MPSPVDTWRPRADPQFDLGAGALGLIGQLLQQPAEGWLKGKGFTPGQFAPTQSFYDRLQGQQYNFGMAQAMQQASQADQARYLEMARGAFFLTHKPGETWGKPQQQAAQGFAQGVAAMGPFLAQLMPATFDQAHGRRGSAQVMAMNVFDAARFLQTPGGGMGLSGAGAGQLSAGLTDELFAPRGGLFGAADNANLARMNGLGAGQAGMMFGEMARRGTLGGSTGNAAGDTTRIAGKLREMSGAVRAMQDIFGDQGNPDAPMREIFENLDKLTQGGLASMNPAQIKTIVRRMHALSHQTGLGIEAVAGMVDAGGRMAGAVGLSGQFGTSTAASSAAFGLAWGNMAGPQGFGGLSKDQATQLDQRLRTSAAASAQGNSLGAVANLAEQGLLRGVDTRTAAGRDKLQQILQQTAAMNRQQAGQFLQANYGVGAGTFGSFLAGREANQGAALRNGVADVVRENQFREVGRVMDNALAAGALGALRDAGVGPAAGAMSGRVARVLREAITAMDPDLLNNPERVRERNAALKAALKAAGVALPEAQLDDLVARAFQSLDQRVRSNPSLKGYGSVGGLVSLNRADVLRQGRANVARADAAGAGASATAGLGQQDVVSRITDAVRGAKPGDDMTKVIAAGLGGIPADQVAAALGVGKKPADGSTPAAGAGGVAAGGAITIRGTLDLKSGEITGTGKAGTVPVPGGG